MRRTARAARIVVLALALSNVVIATASAEITVRLSNGTDEGAGRLVLDQTGASPDSTDVAGVIVDLGSSPDEWRFQFRGLDEGGNGPRPTIVAPLAGVACDTFDYVLDPNSVEETVVCVVSSMPASVATQRPLIYLGDGNTIGDVNFSSTAITLAAPYLDLGVELRGEAGLDDLNGSSGPDVIDGGSGGDWLVGFGGNDLLRGGTENDNLSGGDGADTLQGEAGNDILTGDDGSDTIVGGTGADEVYGETSTQGLFAGDDTIDVRDGETDTKIDCGNGADTATADAATIEADSHFSGCETISRPEIPQVEDPKPQTPAPPKTDIVGGITLPVGSAIDTTKVVAFPVLRGKDLAQAGAVLLGLGIVVDANRTKVVPFAGSAKKVAQKYGARPGGAWKIGDILRTNPASGSAVTVGARSTVGITYDVWIGPTRDSCAEEMREFTGLGWEEFQKIAKDLGCRIDDVELVFDKTARECVVANKLVGQKNELDAVLRVPRDKTKLDLHFVLRMNDEQISLDRVARLPASERGDILDAGFIAQVLDKAGNPVNGVDVYLDLRGVGGGLAKATTASVKVTHPVTKASATIPGAVKVTEVNAKRVGNIELAAIQSGRNGGSVCGAATIPTFYTGGAHDSGHARYEQTNGLAAAAFFNTTTGKWRWKLIDPAFPTKQIVTPDRGSKALVGDVKPEYVSAGANPIWDFFVALFANLGVTKGVKPTTDANRAKAAAAASGAGFSIVRSTVGGASNGATDPAKLVPGGTGKVFVIGANNVIATVDASLLANDGASLIANDGSSLIANDGASFAAGMNKNGNLLISDHGGGVVAIRGTAYDIRKADVLTVNGAAVIASGVSVVAAGAGNVMFVPKANIVAGGAGN